MQCCTPCAHVSWQTSLLWPYMCLHNMARLSHERLSNEFITSVNSLMKKTYRDVNDTWAPRSITNGISMVKGHLSSYPDKCECQQTLKVLQWTGVLRCLKHTYVWWLIWELSQIHSLCKIEVSGRSCSEQRSSRILSGSCFLRLHGFFKSQPEFLQKYATGIVGK